MLQPWMIPADLAPGDAKSLAAELPEMILHRIGSSSEPEFAEAYGRLVEEFGEADEIEQEGVIRSRLGRDGTEVLDNFALRYRLMLVTAPCGEFAAVRDHTAIVETGRPGAVVHLSHNLVAPKWRRSGLAGWMRALPVQTARSALAAQSRKPDEPIILVGEMEAPDPAVPATLVRLKAYERASFSKVNPADVNYLQPDFRDPSEIDAGGGPLPLRMQLVVRQVGREAETRIDGGTVRAVAAALYGMFAREFRAADMEPLWMSLDGYPRPGSIVELVPPCEGMSLPS